ncbi:MAG: DUF177 domain-containing protein [Ruminococcaceae bacterium]|nr:DUF177 domain-containing protein [Oscillospiraceae bacterium]
MVFDVQSILKTDGAKMQLAGLLDVPELYQNSEYDFGEGARFSGVVANIGGVLELTVSAEGTFCVPCARCAKETRQTFSVSVRETLTDCDGKATESEERVLLCGTSLDMDDVLWPEIFLTLEPKYLCKPDCKGLCPQCGADLNENPCDCKEDTIDPRMAGLADLLQ